MTPYFLDQERLRRDATVHALRRHHADLDLDPIQPAGVLRREVKLEPAEDGGSTAVVSAVPRLLRFLHGGLRPIDSLPECFLKHVQWVADAAA